MQPAVAYASDSQELQVNRRVLAEHAAMPHEAAALEAMHREQQKVQEREHELQQAANQLAECEKGTSSWAELQRVLTGGGQNWLQQVLSSNGYSTRARRVSHRCLHFYSSVAVDECGISK